MSKRKTIQRATLSVALSLCIAGGVNAQSTTGSIYGSAPAGEGTTVVVQNNSGFSRTITVDASGRYNVGNLPVGTYSVTLQREGQVVETRKDIVLRVGSGTDVSFADATTLGAITVTAVSVPPVDVTTLDSRTVITSEQLARLPIRRSAEAIALMSPGAVPGSSNLGGSILGRNVVSFGGAGASENAYYLNGYFTGDPSKNLGGFALPYGAIDQQETYTGGYAAKYGRSDGGVISQIGKRGTNDVHFGGEVVWRPKQLSEHRDNLYYPNQTLPTGFGYEDPDLSGTMYKNYQDDENWSTTMSGYIGGPLIKDRLFAFVAAETEWSNSVGNPIEATAGTLSERTSHFETQSPKIYAKVDWTINDNNLLELTYLYREQKQNAYYNTFDLATRTEGGRLTDGTGAEIIPNVDTLRSEYYIGKYTGYITDNLTFSAVYGQSWSKERLGLNPNTRSDLAYISGANFQNPAYTNGAPNGITNSNTQYYNDGGNETTRGLRADLEWVLGDHTLAGGIDNMEFEAKNRGRQVAGLGAYVYSRATNPNNPLNPTLGVGAPGGDGYYVYNVISSYATDTKVEQKAYYLEDRWQVTDNLLLSLGVRNDKFTNYNSGGEVYVEQDNQWAPRFGASWDVFGDSSMKVYGNLGRYYLALPTYVAVRQAGGSTNTSEYFTYTGIDSNGMPTGLTALGPGPVSANGEYGNDPDPRNTAPTDLKSMYQDELILGFDKTLGSKWAYGAKATYRTLQASIDDICDPYKFAEKAVEMGLDPDTVGLPGYNVEPYCVLFNPEKTNTYNLARLDANGNPTGERIDIKMSAKDWGLEGYDLQRDYLGVNLYLEHPFDGKWEGRIDYTWSRSYGNNEGQVRSDVGQEDMSKTMDWDAAEIMMYSNGYLANDRRHSIKLYGSYQINPQWMVSGNIRIQSGAPKTCIGYLPEGEDPLGYGGVYHSCGGEPFRPGKTRTDWTNQVDLGVTYRPSIFDDRLSLGLQVLNALNQKKALAYDPWYDEPYQTVSNTYDMPLNWQTPRYVLLSASYDF